MLKINVPTTKYHHLFQHTFLYCIFNSDNINNQITRYNICKIVSWINCEYTTWRPCPIHVIVNHKFI